MKSWLADDPSKPGFGPTGRDSDAISSFARDTTRRNLVPKCGTLPAPMFFFPFLGIFFSSFMLKKSLCFPNRQMLRKIYVKFFWLSSVFCGGEANCMTNTRSGGVLTRACYEASCFLSFFLFTGFSLMHTERERERERALFLYFSFSLLLLFMTSEKLALLEQSYGKIVSLDLLELKMPRRN